MKRLFLGLCYCIPLAAGPRVTVSADRNLAAPARYGLDKLQRSLQDSNGTGEVLVVAGLGDPGGVATAALKSLRVDPPKGPEALVIRKTRIQGKPAVVLCGSDARGLMYAALDTADRAGWSRGGDALAEVRDTEEAPYVAERGISIYTMQRAYFESRLHDAEYWKSYFDLLAASRINRFLVVFGYENGGFMAPLYPFFFDVEQFPDVRLVGITRQQQERNTADFQQMIRLAHERGIAVAAGIWDHIYRGGVQGGGIPGASDTVGKQVPGLVFGVTTDNLDSYTKAAIRKFVGVFPELDGIQFRMHDESGLKPSEMAGFWHEVFGTLKQRKPPLHVELRVKGLPDEIITDALAQGLDVRLETKYWMEQMGLPFHPTHVNVQDQKNRRHGYADLLRYPQRYTVNWRLWTGGTARVLLWADPEYVRRFAESVHLYNGNSFDVNEMLATKMLGEPHDEAPIPIHTAKYRDYRYEFQRYWHYYQVWGRVSYNPATSPEVWQREFDRRFGAAGRQLMEAEHTASQILPRIVAASYRYSDFPTTRGWAEMMRGGDLPGYANEDGSDTEQFLTVRAEARRIVDRGETAMRRPQETSRWFEKISGAVLEAVAEAQKQAGPNAPAEFTTAATDLKILAWLAKYHASRLPAGVSYNLYKLTRDAFFLNDAIAYEKEAAAAWEKMAAAAGDIYSDNLAFGVHAQGFSRNWKEELGKLQSGIAQLEKEQANAAGPSSAAGPTPHTRAMDFGGGVTGSGLAVTLMPVAAARPGRAVEVAARVAGSGSPRLRMRYRHLTQYEDYLMLVMNRDAVSGLYKASIPAEFVVPNWDLMFFVEAFDGEGHGRIYPDLEKQAPYVIVKLAR